MIQEVLLVFAAVFAVIGFVAAVGTAVEILGGGKKCAAPVDVVIYANNTEEEIEGVVRTLAAMMTSGVSKINYRRLVAVCVGSTDSTCEILKRLEKEIDILSVE